MTETPGKPSGEPGMYSGNNKSYSSSSSSSSGRSYQYTSKQDANAMIDNIFFDWFGRKATALEKKNFFNQLHKFEGKYASRSSSKSGGGGGSSTVADPITGDSVTSSSSSDRSRSKSVGYSFSAGDFANTYAQGLASKIIATGKFGGKAREYYNKLQAYANNMGQMANDKLITSDVAGILGGKRSEQNATEYYRNQAIKMYGAAADRLKQDATLTMRDIAAPLINTYSSMLEQDPNTVSLTNPTIQDALLKGTSISELSKTVRKNPLFQYTNNAKSEASNIANSFKNAWGF